jgi:hypothetical protein
VSAKPQTGRLMKAECPTCEMIAYLSRGAVIRHGMPACACGSRLFFSKLDVQLEALPELAHEHPDFKAHTELEIRRAQRAAANHVLVANRMRCGGCNAWIGSANERHSCGFHNDVRANRNHGRWVSGSSRLAAALPFSRSG